jgi:hypothetical protein
VISCPRALRLWANATKSFIFDADGVVDVLTMFRKKSVLHAVTVARGGFCATIGKSRSCRACVCVRDLRPN